MLVRKTEALTTRLSEACGSLYHNQLSFNIFLNQSNLHTQKQEVTLEKITQDVNPKIALEQNCQAKNSHKKDTYV